MRRIGLFCNVGALAAAMGLIVAAAGFEADALEGAGLGLGIAGLLVSLWWWAVLVHQRRLDGDPEFKIRGRAFGAWSTLSAGIAAVGVWETIAATIFAPSVNRWLTLGNGIAIACMAIAGLVVHEYTSERIVHVLEVVERPRSDSL